MTSPSFSDYNKCGVLKDRSKQPPQIRTWSRVETNCNMDAYKNFTSEQLNNRRKEEILEYKKNLTPFTKNQLYSYANAYNNVKNKSVFIKKANTLICPYEYYFEWEQFGDDLSGDNSFGSSLTLNSLGDRLVVGTPDSSVVSIYDLNSNGKFNQNENYDLSGDFSFGASLALNSQGDRLVVGTQNKNIITFKKAEEIKLLNSTNNTTQIGQYFNFKDSGCHGNYNANEEYTITFDCSNNSGWELTFNSFAFDHTATKMNDRLSIQTTNTGVNYTEVSIPWLQKSTTSTYPYSNRFNGAVWNNPQSINGYILPKDTSRAISLGWNQQPLRITDRFIRFKFKSYSLTQKTGWDINLKADSYDLSFTSTVNSYISIYDLSSNGKFNQNEKYDLSGDYSFGSSLTLNRLGDRLVVGTPNTNKVSIYDLNSNGKFNQNEKYDLFGDVSFGGSLALNSQGERLVVGTSNGNYVSIYDLSSNGKFNQNEKYDLSGDYSFGASLTLNSLGDRLVVGNKLNKIFSIYDLSSNGKFNQNEKYDLSNNVGLKQLSLNSLGDRLVVGSTNNCVKVFNLTKKILEKTEDIVPLVNYYVRRKY